MKKILLSLIIIGALSAGVYAYFNLPIFNKDSKSEDEESDSYCHVMAFSDKDELMVASKIDGYYVVDYKGNIKGKIDGSCGSETTIMNNYIYTNSKVYGENDYNYVFDSKGKEVYKVNGAIGGVSENGYCITEEDEENMARGKYLQYNIIDLKTGKSVYEKDYDHVQNGFQEFKYSNYKDYFIKEESNSEIAIDAKTLEEYKNYASNKEYLKNESEELKDLKMPYYNGGTNYSGSNIIDVNKKLLLKKGNIIDFDGNELKDVSEGDVKYISSYGDNIFVVTETGYVYTLDKNYEYKVKPQKISDTDLPVDILEKGVHLEDYINCKAILNHASFYITSAGYFYVDHSTDNNITTLKITIIDDETFKKIKTIDLKVKNLEYDCMFTDNGLLINSSDDNAYVIKKDAEKKYEKSRIGKYTNNMVNIISDGKGTVISLDSLKELKIKE